MRVILQEKVANLGNVGDIVDVKPGFARNFLLPQGKVVRATDVNLADFEKRRVDLEKRAQADLEKAQTRLEQLKVLSLVLEAQCSDEGKLFGSISPREIAEAATQAGVELCKSEVKLPEGPIRAVGQFEVDIILHSDVHGQITIEVKAAE